MNIFRNGLPLLIVAFLTACSSTPIKIPKPEPKPEPKPTIISKPAGRATNDPRLAPKAIDSVTIATAHIDNSDKEPAPAVTQNTSTPKPSRVHNDPRLKR